MKVDHVLLLAAGKGTRMGEIGKSLPKVQWPIFEKTLLELQVAYVKELVKTPNIYINIFHDKDNIKNYITSNKAFDDITIVEESEPLDIGGAVHNLAGQLNYQGNLLIINSDQFLYFHRSIFEQGLDLLEKSDGVLFSYEVNSDDLYGALDIVEGKFKGIIPNNKIERNTKMITYTGMSLWNMSSMDKCSGKSHFFETVANAKTKTINTLEIKEFEYWDFGTLKRYYRSMFNLLRDKKSNFKDFLINEKAIDIKKITGSSYDSESGINLSGNFIEDCYESIYMTNSNIKVEEGEKSVIRLDQKQHIGSV